MLFGVLDVTALLGQSDEVGEDRAAEPDMEEGSTELVWMYLAGSCPSLFADSSWRSRRTASAYCGWANPSASIP
ncbi:hypothetical protein ACFXTO_003275 [Malus domestica]